MAKDSCADHGAEVSFRDLRGAFIVQGVCLIHRVCPLDDKDAHTWWRVELSPPSYGTLLALAMRRY